MIKFIENIFINIFVLLRNIKKSQSCKCIAIFLIVLMLWAKIIVFGIIVSWNIEVTR